MRIALAQINPTSGDIDGNTAKILEAIATRENDRNGCFMSYDRLGV